MKENYAENQLGLNKRLIKRLEKELEEYEEAVTEEYRAFFELWTRFRGLSILEEKYYDCWHEFPTEFPEPMSLEKKKEITLKELEKAKARLPKYKSAITEYRKAAKESDKIKKQEKIDKLISLGLSSKDAKIAVESYRN